MAKKKTDTKRPQRRVLSPEEILHNMLTISERKEDFIAYILKNEVRGVYSGIKKKNLQKGDGTNRA